MAYSDIIAAFLLEILGERDGICEVSRAELARRFGCVPSQINYVLATRFSPEHGYAIETKRGGGGYIRITRMRLGKSILEEIGHRIDERTARAFLSNLDGLIAGETGTALLAAVSDQTLRRVPPVIRDVIRADILKACLLNV